MITLGINTPQPGVFLGYFTPKIPQDFKSGSKRNFFAFTPHLPQDYPKLTPHFLGYFYPTIFKLNFFYPLRHPGTRLTQKFFPYKTKIFYFWGKFGVLFVGYFWGKCGVFTPKIPHNRLFYSKFIYPTTWGKYPRGVF